MPKTSNSGADPALLTAALEGLELQRRRIEQQIEQVKSLLGRRRAPAAAGMEERPASSGKRDLSPAARKRIALAQKRRWAEYRKNKAAASSAS